MTPTTLRDLKIGDAGWLIQRHAELYARDEGFDASFEVLVAEVLAGFIRSRRTPPDRAWIAVNGEMRLGSIFCVGVDEKTAQLRLFFLEPEARGKGLGKRLLNACIDHARATGFAELILWTHASHIAACALYRAFGFEMTGETPKRSFGTDVIEQSWKLRL